MENAKNWYVVHTKPKCEKKVADLLERKKIKTFYPRYNEVKYWQEKRKIVNVPLFSSLVFAYACEQEQSTIKQLDGVSGLLFWLQKPAIITDSEIGSIRSFLKENSNIKLERIQVNAGHDAGIIELNNTHNKLNLPSLGFALVAEAMINQGVKIVA